MSDRNSVPKVHAVPERLSFDKASLEAFLASAMPQLTGQIAVSKFTGGQSNPTYRIDTDQGALVLRRKPPGRTLASAHAVDREARAMRGLGRVGFPVPKVFAECKDAGVIGSPFYIMEYLDGRIFWDPLLPGLRPEERRAVYFALADALAELHAVDIDAAGLAEFGPRANYYARQVERWTAQYRAVADDPIPEMEKLAAWLAANVPVDDLVSVVHGDFRLDNVIFHKDRPEVVGVIDWELATLGNPLADLSYFLLNWVAPLSVSGRSSLSGVNVSAIGIPTAEEVIERYFTRSNVARPASFTFHHAYNLFRLAAILHGIAGRSRTGNASSDKADQMGAMVRPAAMVACGLVGIA